MAQMWMPQKLGQRLRIGVELGARTVPLKTLRSCSLAAISPLLKIILKGFAMKIMN